MLYFGAVAFMTDGQFRIRGAGDIAADWQSVLKFGLWLGAGVIGFAHLPPLSVILRRPACVAWLAYIGLAMASGIYSPIGDYSFGCAVALLCLFAFSFSLSTHLTEGQILWTLLIAITIFNIGGWIVYYAIPDLGGSLAWTITGEYKSRMSGLAGQATNLGAMCAKGVGAAFVLWYTRRAGPIVSLILGTFAFVTLLKSDSRTAEVATIIGLGVIVASRSVWLIAGGALSGVLALLMLQLFPDLMGLLERLASRSGDPVEIQNLTGRLQIWDFCWDQITRSPILGYGYNASKFLLGNHVGFENDLMVDSAHNLFLQNLLSLGFLGMIPLGFLLVYLLWEGVMRPLPIVSYTLVLILISSISDSEAIGMTPTLMTIMFFLVSVWPGLDRNRPNMIRPRSEIRQPPVPEVAREQALMPVKEDA
jgi:O-antigen ligase